MALVALIISIIALLLALIAFFGFFLSAEVVRRRVIIDLLSNLGKMGQQINKVAQAQFEKDVIRQGKEDA